MKQSIRTFLGIIAFALLITTFAQAQKLYIRTGPDGKYGFLDKDGKVVVPYKYDQISAFHKGFARVQIGDLYGYVDKDGKEVIECIYENVSNFRKGVVRVYKDSKIAYYNDKGEMVDGWFEYLGNIEDYISLIKKNDQYAFLDEAKGKIVGEWYDYIEGFQNGRAMVGKDGKYFYINKKGEVVEEVIIEE